MYLTDQVITLEQAQKLRELKFSEPSIFYWCIWWDKCQRDWTIIAEDDDSTSYEQWLQAYTVSELMEYLPETIIWYKRKIYLNKNQYKITYDVDINSNWWELFTSNDNLAQALWDMLIYLISNKYIECN